MYEDHKEITDLYLGIARYRMRFERQMKRDGNWSYGTLLVVVTEIRQAAESFKGQNLEAFLRFQQLIEIGCEYLCRNRDNGNYQEFSGAVRFGLKEAGRYFNRFCTENMLQIYEKSLAELSKKIAELEQP